MQARHQDRALYFNETAISFEQHVLPYIEDVFPLQSSMTVLEIGCGEGGNLIAVLKKGCSAVGVDLDAVKIEYGNTILQEKFGANKVRIIVQDIYTTTPEEIGCFDLIILRDVIEHIHQQDRFMHYVKQFLTPQGCIFFAFPPWQMPFGGHQQICESKWLSHLPYMHVLPKFFYRALLKLGGEQQSTIDCLLEIKDTSLSIERFFQIVKKEHYQIIKKTLFLINPYYEVKFKLKTRKQFKFIAAIPWVRNFFTTSCYCLLKK